MYFISSATFRFLEQLADHGKLGLTQITLR